MDHTEEPEPTAGLVGLGTQPLPCNTPCPKCGNHDIRRLYYAEGDHIENEKCGKPPCEWTFEYSVWQYSADRELIKHHCRCCQYGWVTEPVSINLK